MYAIGANYFKDDAILLWQDLELGDKICICISIFFGKEFRSNWDNAFFLSFKDHFIIALEIDTLDRHSTYIIRVAPESRKIKGICW